MKIKTVEDVIARRDQLKEVVEKEKQSQPDKEQLAAIMKRIIMQADLVETHVIGEMLDKIRQYDRALTKSADEFVQLADLYINGVVQYKESE